MSANVLNRLTDEHDTLLPIIVKIQAATEAQDETAPFNLCLQLCNLIQTHMQREDMMLFPSARDALDTEAFDLTLDH